MKKTILLLTALMSLTIINYVSAQTLQWNTYTNTTVGFRISVPSNLTRTPYKEWAPNGDPSSPAQWRTTLFESPDKKVSLEISTHSNSLQKSLQDFFHEDVAQRTEGGDEINYSVLKNNWFVVSAPTLRGSNSMKSFSSSMNGGLILTLSTRLLNELPMIRW